MNAAGERSKRASVIAGVAVVAATFLLVRFIDALVAEVAEEAAESALEAIGRRRRA